MPPKKVLLVSTDPMFFETPENSFQTRGCDVFTAMSGAEAVEFLLAYGADLVLSHGAPEDVAPERIRNALGEEGHIVIVSNDDNAPGIAAFKKLGNVHVVEDPVLGKNLLKVTGRLLGIPNRKYISILVQVRVTQPKATTVFGKSRDLSDTGILVETNQSLIMHDQVVVSFLIPGADRMIQAQALVAREVEGPGGARRYGLKFLSLSEDERRIVTEYLSGQASR